MKRDADGLPKVGSNSSELGVRVAPHPNADVEDDGNGQVRLNDGGMSVSENWRYMLAHLIPKRLKPRFSGAAGKDSLSCYRHGTGAFTSGSLDGHANLSLMLKPHDPHAGLVVPSQAVTIPHFQAHLAATRTEWVVDEN